MFLLLLDGRHWKNSGVEKKNEEMNKRVNNLDECQLKAGTVVIVQVKIITLSDISQKLDEIRYTGIKHWMLCSEQ